MIFNQQGGRSDTTGSISDGALITAPGFTLINSAGARIAGLPSSSWYGSEDGVTFAASGSTLINEALDTVSFGQTGVLAGYDQGNWAQWGATVNHVTYVALDGLERGRRWLN